MMDEDSKQYTALTVGNLGFLNVNRCPLDYAMPQPLSKTNAKLPGRAQSYCLIYVDDVIVYAKNEEEHLDRLRTVFERFRKDNLKLKPSKCDLFQKEITYLAHDVSAEGIR